jgi:hypothetical protein
MRLDPDGYEFHKRRTYPWFVENEHQLANILRKTRFIENFKGEAITLPSINVREREIFDAAKAANRTQYSWEDVTYCLNSLGFRGEWELDDINGPIDGIRILTLGCSFTIGEALPQDAAWPWVMKRELEKAGLKVQLINMGVSGSGIGKQARIASMLSDFYKFSYVVSLSPQPLRIELAKYERSGSVGLHDIVPNFPHPHVVVERDHYLKYATEEVTYYDFLRNVRLIQQSAVIMGATPFFGSWDLSGDAVLTSQPTLNKMPRFLCMEAHPEFHNKFARDGGHPGPHSHDIYGTMVANMITNHRSSTGLR